MNQNDRKTSAKLNNIIISRWGKLVSVSEDAKSLTTSIECDISVLQDIAQWLFIELKYSFATMIVEEHPEVWNLRYIFYGDRDMGLIQVIIYLNKSQTTIPSIAPYVYAADWYEREAEDLFGFNFEGHPRLGDFVLHEEWQDGINPMRKNFDAFSPYTHRVVNPDWTPVRVVQSPGAFMMPVGPIYSDFAESAHFLLETVGEDVIRTIPRLFYKYRGVEKIAEGNTAEHAILLSERFSGTSAFAHSMALCHAIETISDIKVPERARYLRIIFAELERLRQHVNAITAICNSTGFSVAASQAGILEEELLRVSCHVTGHRYLFGLNTYGGLTIDVTEEAIKTILENVENIIKQLNRLERMLYRSNSFLDRLEGVGILPVHQAISYGVVGPVARASGINRDLRKALPYGGYENLEFIVPVEYDGDGYARLRVLFEEARQSANIIHNAANILPAGSTLSLNRKILSGSALSWVEAPRGAAFHWVDIGEDTRINRYRLTTPSFNNWNGFHRAAEKFAFQDFPIIMATFDLSTAESDR
jgi:formate hydrogenlyase subunit 5